MVSVVRDHIKKLHIIEAVYALAFGIMCVLSRHVVSEPAGRATILTTYTTPFMAIDVLVVIAVAVAIYALLQGIKWAIGKINSDLFVKNVGNNEVGNNTSDTVSSKASRAPICVMWIVIFAFIMIAWIPYFMSYWPGGIYNDTLDSIHIALRKSEFTNQNTVLYALFWRFMFWVGQIIDQGEYGGLKFMTIVQPMIMAGAASTFFVWLRKKNFRMWVIVLGVLIFAFTPIFPFYAVSMWKDTLFGVNLFLYSFMVYALVEHASCQSPVANKESRSAIDAGKTTGPTIDAGKATRPTIANTALYVLLSALVMFGRNNGIYIVMVTAVALIFFLRKGKKDSTDGDDGRNDNNSADGGKRGRVPGVFVIINICMIIAYFIITGPVYKACGIKPSNPAEKYGIPVQQVAYMVSSGAKMSPEEQAIIEGVLPVEGWINLYDPEVVDTIKFDPLFNAGYFKTHTGDFIRAYAGMVLKNPDLAFKGYLLSTIGFWDAFKASSNAYICTEHCYGSEFFMSDYFVGATGKTLSEIVGPRWYLSSGLMVWIMLGCLALTISRGKTHGCAPTVGIGKTRGCDSEPDNGDMSVGASHMWIVFVPTLTLWLTIMIATPISFTFRYVFALLLCMPLYIMCVCRAKTE